MIDESSDIADDIIQQAHNLAIMVHTVQTQIDGARKLNDKMLELCMDITADNMKSKIINIKACLEMQKAWLE